MKIPVDPRSQSITGEAPSIFMPMDSGLAVDKALAQGGEDLSSVTNRLIGLNAEYEARKTKARDTIQKAVAETAFTVGMNDFIKQAKERPDYQNIDADYQAHIEKTLPTILDTIDDPLQRKVLEQSFLQHASVIGKGQIDAIVQKKYHETIQNNFATYVVPEFQNIITNAETPEQSQAYSEQFKDYAEKLMQSGAITREVAVGAVETVVHGGEVLKAKKMLTDGDIDIDAVYDKKLFPNLREEDYFKLESFNDRREAIAEREQRAIQKGIYDENAKIAYDRWEAWNRDKKYADGKPFETWLEEERTAGRISEKTYEAMNNKIEKKKDRIANAPERWSVDKYIQFGKIEAKFRDPSNNMGFDDIADAVKGMPNSAAGRLAVIVGSKPSKERASVLNTETKFIHGKLREAEASSETWEKVDTEWKTRSKDTPDKDIPALAREIISTLPEDSMTKMIRETKEKKAGKSGNKTETKPKSNDPLGLR